MKYYLYLLLSISIFVSCANEETNFKPQTETDILKYIEDSYKN